MKITPEAWRSMTPLEQYNAYLNAHEQDRELCEFAGFLTAYLPELHTFETPKMLDAIAAFKAAKDATKG